MKVVVMPVVTGVLRTISQLLEWVQKELEIGERIGTIQSTVFLGLPWIPFRVLDIWGHALFPKLKRKTPS